MMTREQWGGAAVAPLFASHDVIEPLRALPIR
jgi:hypothetical protein